MTLHDTNRSAVESARAIADAVLFEGYMLYPYRADDPKNRVRWQFGVLAPPAFAAVDQSERAFLQSELLVEGADVELSTLVRFLHVQQRTVERLADFGYEAVDTLDVGEATYLPWDEAVVHESSAAFVLRGSTPYRESVDLAAPGTAHAEILRTAEGKIAGRLVRNRAPLQARLEIEAEPLPGPYGVRRLRVRLENCTDWIPAVGEASATSADPGRPDALRHALVAAHLLLMVRGGAFVSLIDPPEWAASYAGTCDQIGTFPVLAGPPGDRSLMLASPIILYDHPQVAPESTTQFCDATEMDEMLTLRTLTLSEAEKRLVRGSDPRAAALVDHVDALPPELMDRLHGAIRSMTATAHISGPTMEEPGEPMPWWDPAADGTVDPETDFIIVGGIPVGRGMPVRLRPGSRCADAQDMFLDGRTARVEAVLADVDGGYHLAVTLDDLAEDGYNPHGRFLYFAPDEVEPIVVDA